MQPIDIRSDAQWVRLRELLAAAERHDGRPPVSDQAVIAARQGKRDILASDEAVGIIGEGELDLVVHPAARGRGIGTSALTELLRLGGPRLLAWSHGENPAADALLEAAGFAPVRELLLMTLEPTRLPEAIAASRPLPKGFEVRAFDPRTAPSAAAEWVRVNAAAFASHPEQGAMTLTDFEALQSEPWFEAEDLRLAYDLDGPHDSSDPKSDAPRLAAYTWVKTTRDAAGVTTELYAIGVDPPFAGRGLGAAMLGETLRRMRVHGPDRITLYVDGDNLAARELYERAGFEVSQRSTQWLLERANNE